MRPLRLLCSIISTGVIFGCGDERSVDSLAPTNPFLAKGRPPSGPTLIQLPSLGSNAEAWGVDAAGTTIVGHSFDRAGMLHPVKWTLQNGSWTITTLPYATSAVAKAVNDQGDAAGYDFIQPAHAILWPAAGGPVTLGCALETGVAQVWAISASARIVVGNRAGNAAVWTPGSCREDLPRLGAGGFSIALAVNGDATIIGGTSAPNAVGDGLPVRWTGSPGARQIDQLDTRVGSVHGANAAGDLAGRVKVSCSLADGCDRAIIWYAAGSVNALSDLVPLGEQGVATDVNSAGEVAGYLTTGMRSTAYFWSQQLGVVVLPSNSRTAAARALSAPRPDGSRLVVGTISVSGIRGAVWVVRNP